MRAFLACCVFIIPARMSRLLCDMRMNDDIVSAGRGDYNRRWVYDWAQRHMSIDLAISDCQVVRTVGALVIAWEQIIYMMICSHANTVDNDTQGAHTRAPHV